MSDRMNEMTNLTKSRKSPALIVFDEYDWTLPGVVGPRLDLNNCFKKIFSLSTIKYLG